MGYDLSQLSNIRWLPTQPNLARVYEQTTILLAPSVWFEPSGRVVAEAQLCGIPVLATRRGGIPEQLNGGGFLFDVPDTLLKNPARLPEQQDVKAWLDVIVKLMSDDAFYVESSTRALEAAAAFRPENTEADVLHAFDGVANPGER